MLEASVEALPAALPETYAEDVELLETRINRWRALQQVVRCVPLISPIDNYHVTSPFGKRKDPFNNRWAIHEGVDLGGWPGISIMAAAPGTVVRAGRDGGYGNKVVIDHGCGIRTVYAHMKSIAVKKGQRVEHRETIGKLGSTGRSTGPHVHYEVQVDGEPLDPEQFIEAGKHVFKI
ncbi:M23 family metallopeptidase [Marivibrio halodurans]|uniref:M23 family metallopeptidase n=2 Tax=Marivibrio halodurans TaxID=2039722 RepID=A0A8J7RZI5_9PROT|nr:M23 family metallopeptidase [Marivibrio halodurans]MBP5855928.1 M23 family metallopeptidase [Marivibrio halodurans]